VGGTKPRPNAEAGYNACLAASSQPVQLGTIGAGAGATIGKMFGPKFAVKSGLGSASVKVADTGIVVGAIVAVNAAGDVYNPRTGRLVAGPRKENGVGFRSSIEAMMRGYRVVRQEGANTTIGCVATNVALEKVQVAKVAQMAHDGAARAINPMHTPSDGDTIFALATGTLRVKADHGAIGALAAEAMSQAIVRAVVSAISAAGFPAFNDIKRA